MSKMRDDKADWAISPFVLIKTKKGNRHEDHRHRPRPAQHGLGRDRYPTARACAILRMASSIPPRVAVPDGGAGDLGPRLVTLYRGLRGHRRIRPDAAAVRTDLRQQGRRRHAETGTGARHRPAGPGRGRAGDRRICPERGEEDRRRCRPCRERADPAHGPLHAAGVSSPGRTPPTPLPWQSVTPTICRAAPPHQNQRISA